MNGIRKLRENAGITQAELAERLNVAQPTIAGWEKGTSNPRVDLIPLLAKELKCEINALFESDNQAPA